MVLLSQNSHKFLPESARKFVSLLSSGDAEFVAMGSGIKSSLDEVRGMIEGFSLLELGEDAREKSPATRAHKDALDSVSHALFEYLSMQAPHAMKHP